MPIPIPMPFMDFSAYRPGQYDGHMVLVERVQAGERYTTIVLPTRYGKTDVIRGTAIHLYRQEKIACALVLSPGVNLRDQVTNTTKWNTFIHRYSVDMTGIRYRSLPAKNYLPEVNFAANGEMLVSVSTQLVDTNVAFFLRWAESMHHRTGKPILVYVDEAHTGSESNSWGNTVEKLVQAGAFAALFTATPYRSDGKMIPGFPIEDIHKQQVLHYIARPADDPTLIHVDVHDAMDRTWRLAAHHETTFREAWDQSTIANVSRFPFDVNMSEIAKDGEVDTGLLSMLSEEKTRRYLHAICCDARVMRKGVDIFVEQLRAIRSLAPTAGIVFCGNDSGGPDRETNQHAKRLQELIYEQEPSWKVVIATSANPEDEADVRIKQFIDEDHPVGDVLIVKQMAGRGIDVGRLKVILDLSPIRTEAAWIQRIMRAATLYANLPAIYITPDDCLSRERFDRLIATQGGEMTSRDVGELLRSYDKERATRPVSGLYVEDTDGSDFQDNLGREGEREFHELVRVIVSMCPPVLNGNSHAGLAEELHKRGFKIQPPPKYHGDTTPELAIEREQANSKVQKIVHMRLHGQRYDQKTYEETIKAVWRTAYQRIDHPFGVSLGGVADLEVLKRLNRILAQMEAQERAGYATYRS